MSFQASCYRWQWQEYVALFTVSIVKDVPFGTGCDPLLTAGDEVHNIHGELRETIRKFYDALSLCHHSQLMSIAFPALRFFLGEFRAPFTHVTTFSLTTQSFNCQVAHEGDSSFEHRSLCTAFGATWPTSTVTSSICLPFITPSLPHFKNQSISSHLSATPNIEHQQKMASTSNNNAPPPYESHSFTQAPPPPPHALKTRNGIPPQSRRSMEDEQRPLPDGWIRQYDRESHHQFFVDTSTDRSIWHHPYDDDQYLDSLPPSEKTKIKLQGLSLRREPSQADIEAESSEDDSHPATADSHPNSGQGQGGKAGEHIGATHRFGRKMKDQITASTHEEREERRRKRAEQEEKAYRQHQHFRECMVRAEETGEPQLLGRDREWKEVYIEPSGMGGGGGMSRGMYGNGGYGINPYSQGMYADPDSRFARPQGNYCRPYGCGYGGGGYGMPLAAGMGAGLGTGLLLGDMFWL